MNTTMLASVALVAASPFVGRAVGSWAAKRRWVEFGKARSVMPGLPREVTPAIAQLGRRFDARVDAAAAQIYRKMLASGTKGLTAEALAAELSLPPEICAAALERLRSRAECHLRVTKNGKLLHDFNEGSLRQLRSDAGLSFISRLTLFLASLLANIGAIWPLFISLLGASLALLGIFGDHSNEHTWFVAVGVVFAVPLSFAFVIGGGVLIGGLLFPTISTPYIGNSLTPGNAAQGKKQRIKRRERAQRAGGSGWHEKITESDALGASDIAKTVAKSVLYVDLPVLLLAGACRMFGVPLSTFFIGFGIILIGIAALFIMGADFDPEAIPFLIVAILAGVVLVAFVGIIFWMFGLWRSLTQEEIPVASPGEHAQRGVKVDDLAVLVPTNDLVLSSYKALQKALSREPHIDPMMALRLQEAAKERGGQLAAFEITLLEGLDPEEALAVGARLASSTKGSIEVSEEGELYFILPNQTHQQEKTFALEECFIRLAQGQFEAPIGMPVSLPGISLSTIEGLERLCAGTLLMFATMWASAAGVWQQLFGQDAWVAREWMVPASALLSLGVFALTGAVRYTARAEIRAGFLRDVRRETMLELQRLLEDNERVLPARGLAQRLTKTAQKLWPSLNVEDVLREVEAACDDLRLELSPDALAQNPKETRPYDLSSLRARINSMKSVQPKDLQSSQDEVIFDSAAMTRAAK